MAESQELPEAYKLTPTDSKIAETIEFDEDKQTVEEGQDHPPMGWMLLRELVETIVLALVIFLLIRLVVQNYRIESHSMLPNFHEGEFIFVNKLAYRLGAPERGDVIVFNNPGNVNEDYIKRVIGLPGDTLEIIDQSVYINGQLLDESFPHNPFNSNRPYGPTVIGPNQIFVMGDNRGNSSDSRAFGPLDEELIVGKAWLRLWPLNMFGLIEHYELEPEPTISLAPQ